jgi:glyoxylate/hydroxypyruvate reductase A
LAVAAPEVRIVQEGEVPPATIEAALVDEPPIGSLLEYRNLRVVLSLSAGVDTLLADTTLPNVPVVRLVNAEMANLMREYVAYHVLRLHRGFAEMERLQQERRWEWMSPSPSARSRRVTVLGLGHLGRPAAEALASLGFQVSAWSRTPKTITGIRCVSGITDLHAVLPDTEILVSVLPLTSETRGLLAEDLFGRLPKGASIINVGRGGCVDESDLLRALDCGQLSHATLDVVAVEPLPENDPLWTHPRVTITPHTAAYPPPETFVAAIARTLERVHRDERFDREVDRARGY